MQCESITDGKQVFSLFQHITITKETVELILYLNPTLKT